MHSSKKGLDVATCDCVQYDACQVIYDAPCLIASGSIVEMSVLQQLVALVLTSSAIVGHPKFSWLLWFAGSGNDAMP